VLCDASESINSRIAKPGEVRSGPWLRELVVSRVSQFAMLICHHRAYSATVNPPYVTSGESGGLLVVVLLLLPVARVLTKPLSVGSAPHGVWVLDRSDQVLDGAKLAWGRVLVRTKPNSLIDRIFYFTLEKR
jgi:hypothetical protein